MAETQPTQTGAAPQDAGMQEKMAQLAQEKAAELEKIATEQVAKANPEQPITMTELLAGEGEFSKLAESLGLQAELQKFQSDQQEIGKLREELVAVEDQRAADAKRVAGLAPAMEQEAGKVKKTSTISGVLGAAAGGAGTVFLASKKTQSAGMRSLLGAGGAVLGGALAAIFGARSGAKKAMKNVEQQVGDIGNLQPNEDLEKKSVELQEQLGQAQQKSISAITEVMVERMVEQQITAEQEAAQQKQQEAAAKENEKKEAAQQEEKPAQAEGQAAPKQEGQAAPGGEAQQPQAAPQQPHPQQPHGAKPAEAGQQAVAQEFERMMAAEGMGPQHPARQEAGAQQHPQAGQPLPRQPQQGAPVAPMEQMLSQRALAAQPSGNKADAILREREQQQGAERQL